MSDVFTASNGTMIETSGTYGRLEVTSSENFVYLLKEHVDALREFFQAERDKELGWWRASPEFVVQPRDGDGVIGLRSVTVLNERLGITTTVWEGDDSRSGYGMAARAYFDAHPASKPWHDARPGEAWVIEAGGVKRAAIVVRYDSGAAFSWVIDGGAMRSNVPTTADGITAGRRVWAPDDGDGDD